VGDEGASGEGGGGVGMSERREGISGRGEGVGGSASGRGHQVWRCQKQSKERRVRRGFKGHGGEALVHLGQSQTQAQFQAQ